jgi:hypothetical protein
MHVVLPRTVNCEPHYLAMLLLAADMVLTSFGISVAPVHSDRRRRDLSLVEHSFGGGIEKEEEGG